MPDHRKRTGRGFLFKAMRPSKGKLKKQMVGGFPAQPSTIAVRLYIDPEKAAGGLMFVRSCPVTTILLRCRECPLSANRDQRRIKIASRRLSEIQSGVLIRRLYRCEKFDVVAGVPNAIKRMD
jgi:hypothetical protein